MIDLTHDSNSAKNRYWNGAVKLTKSELDLSNNSNTISFDDLLDDYLDGAKKILLSSYCIDEDWLLPKLVNVPNVFIVSHSHNETRLKGMKSHPALYTFLEYFI